MTQNADIEPMSGTITVVTQPTCVECNAVWEQPSERWRLKTLFEESPPLQALYCPACHAREFGRAG